MDNLTVSKSNSWHYRLLQKYSEKRCKNWDDRSGNTDICEYVKAVVLTLLYVTIISLANFTFSVISWMFKKLWYFINKIKFFILGVLFIWCNFALWYFVGFLTIYDEVVYNNQLKTFNESVPILNDIFIYISVLVGILFQAIGIIVGIVVVIIGIAFLCKIFTKMCKKIPRPQKKPAHSSTYKLIKEWVLSKKGKYCMKIKIID